ncbi:MAG: Glucose / Sorbosone dehydrogenase [Methanocella sp. PtaU1.Bin125]|nr:MAG: Glucose / Sorbosone dehydrogenase [Methanocella sp. PtaU1.Bin125]
MPIYVMAYLLFIVLLLLVIYDKFTKNIRIYCFFVSKAIYRHIFNRILDLAVQVMTLSSEIKFLIISIPLLLIAIIVVLMQPAMAPDSVRNTLILGEDSSLPLEKIRLPEGFSITIFAENVPNARAMAPGPNGTLFVGSRDAGSVYAVRDNDGNGKADEVVTIARNLRMPSGVAFRNGSLYVAEISRILRYDDIEARLNDPPAPVVVYDRYPKDEWHGWKYIAFGPDGLLYVPVGAPCNICDPDDPYATITRMKPDGTGYEVFARGIRNTVGFDWDPLTGVLWFAEMGRDYLGNDAPPDEINKAPRHGLHFGYPYVHGRSIIDPEYGKGHSPDNYMLPEAELDAHSSPLGMKFYTGTMFPEKYQNNIFVPEHGSWNRDTPIGYRIELLTLDDNRTVTGREVFAEGWLQGDTAWGRPVDLLQMPDGSMLLSDDKAGVIYRITYQK